TVLVLRPNGLRPRVSPVKMAKMMGRMMGAFVASLRPGGQEFPAVESGPMAVLGRVSQRSRARRRRGGQGAARGRGPGARPAADTIPRDRACARIIPPAHPQRTHDQPDRAGGGVLRGLGSVSL